MSYYYPGVAPITTTKNNNNNNNNNSKKNTKYIHAKKSYHTGKTTVQNLM